MESSFRKMLFQKTNFEITNCDKATVGGKLWNSDKTHPFMDLNHNRIYYVLSGQAKVQTTTSELTLVPGNMYLIPAETIIATKCTTFFEHCYLHFTTSNYEFNLFLSLSNFMQECPIDKTIADFFTTVKNNYKSDSPSKSLLAQGAFRIILSKFFENVEFNQNFVKFYDVLLYIQENLSKKISLRDLANIANLEAAYFSTQFSKAFGIPPIQYINKKRIILAQTLLASSRLSVQEISYSCGFENPFYFSKIFKMNVGVSPKQYMEKIRYDETPFST